MTGRRRAAFDPGRLDDLNDVLAPPQPTSEELRSEDEDAEPSSAMTSQHEAAPPGSAAPPSPSTPSALSSGESTETSAQRRAISRARVATSGNRSTAIRQQRSASGRIATAVRIPADVYQGVNDHLLAGAERPSYGQLVMWTVEDHRAAVVAAVEAALPDPADRSPRGRRLAQDRVPIGLQLLAAERAELDELAQEIAEGEVAALRGARVTRTDVAAAALRVAVQERIAPNSQ